MRIKLLSSTAAILFSLQLQAEPASRATIEKLLQVTDAAAMMDQAYLQMDQISEQMLKSTGTGLDKDPQVRQMVKNINALVREELSWKQLEEPMIALYGNVFSEDELQDILAFYQSDVGQKMLKRQPELIQGTMVMMQEQMQRIMPKMKVLVDKQVAEYRSKKQKAGEQ